MISAYRLLSSFLAAATAAAKCISASDVASYGNPFLRPPWLRRSRLFKRRGVQGDGALCNALAACGLPLALCCELFPARKRILDKVCVVVTGITSNFIA
jgi:hypothetical protein